MAKKQPATKTHEEQDSAKGSRSPRPVSIDFLADFANRVARFARRYKEIADRARALNAGPLMATGQPTAERGEGFLDAFLASLVSGLEDLEKIADRNRDEFAESLLDPKSAEQQVLRDAAKLQDRKGANMPGDQ